MKIVDALFALFTDQEFQMFLVNTLNKKQDKNYLGFPSCYNVNFQCVANFHLLIKHHFTYMYCAPTKCYPSLELKVS